MVVGIGSYINLMNRGVQGHDGSNSYMRLLVASWCLREVLFLRFLVQPVQRSQTSVPIYKITNFISWGISIVSKPMKPAFWGTSAYDGLN